MFGTAIPAQQGRPRLEYAVGENDGPGAVFVRVGKGIGFSQRVRKQKKKAGRGAHRHAYRHENVDGKNIRIPRDRITCASTDREKRRALLKRAKNDKVCIVIIIMCIVLTEPNLRNAARGGDGNERGVLGRFQLW